VFAPKGDEVREGWRKCHDMGPPDLCYSLQIFRICASMWWDWFNILHAREKNVN